MKIHRFIVEENLNESTVILKEKELVHQLKDVLKLKTGEDVALCDGKGAEIVGKIASLKKDEVVVRAASKKADLKVILRKVSLYCAILKKDNSEWAVLKATEVGVSEIVPLVAERTVKTGLPRPRLEKIIKEASEQSGRTVLPVLDDPVKFEDAMLEIKNKNKKALFFDLGCPALKHGDPDVESMLKNTDEEIAIFIGPEGGWTERERKLAEESGCLVRSLGPLTLRAETAVVVASYLVTQEI